MRRQRSKSPKGVAPRVAPRIVSKVTPKPVPDIFDKTIYWVHPFIVMYSIFRLLIVGKTPFVVIEGYMTALLLHLMHKRYPVQFGFVYGLLYVLPVLMFIL
jgi:hypothetical protein